MKFKDLVLVNRPETENKWWHRLAQTVTYLGAVILVFSIPTYFIVTEDLELFDTEITSFSFEDNFFSARGKEVNCLIFENQTQSKYESSYEISCDGDKVTSNEFLMLHVPSYILNKALINENNDSFDWSQQVEEGDLIISEIFERTNGNFSAKKIHVLHPHDSAEIFRYIFIGIVAALAWVFIFQSIIYRILLYIIYGKNKKF